MELILSFFKTLEGQFVVDMLLATTLGYIIGFERESRDKDAGIGTHVMVLCGAALYTPLSTLIDPSSRSRIAAQIVTGIGFLGAGLILKEEGLKVRNLTTASSIWFAGAIGMAIGFGYYGIAIIAAVFSVIIPRISRFGKKN